MPSKMSQSFSLQKFLRSFGFALSGLKILVCEENNARVHIAAAILVNLAGLWVGLSATEWALIWICIGFVFVTEILNTAIENICNFISPEKSDAIGRIKDLSAAAVLVASMVSAIVAVFVFASHW